MKTITRYRRSILDKNLWYRLRYKEDGSEAQIQRLDYFHKTTETRSATMWDISIYQSCTRPTRPIDYQAVGFQIIASKYPVRGQLPIAPLS